MYSDMKVMLKLVPNYSSTSNMFFVRSQMNEPYFRDYYIWNPGFSNGDKHTPINNWVCIHNKLLLVNNFMLILITIHFLP